MTTSDEPTHEERERGQLRPREADVRPLGYIALGLGVLSILLALSYLFSPSAYIPAALSLLLGLVTYRDEQTRGTGIVSIVLALIAVLCATAVLFL